MESVELDPNLLILILSGKAETLFLISQEMKKGGFTNLIKTQDVFNVQKICLKGNPDMILIDQYQNQMDGWEVVKNIKNDENLPNLPIVFFGEDDPLKKDEFEEYGIVAYVQKPFLLKSILPVLATTYDDLHFATKDEHFYTKAKKFLLEDLVEKAINIYENIWQKTGSGRSAVGLSLSYEKNREIEKAEKVLETLSDAFSVQKDLLRFKNLVRKSDIAECPQLFRKIMDQSNGSPLYIFKCLGYALEFKFEDLILEICSVAETNGIHNSRIPLARAEVAFMKKNFSEAVKVIEFSEQKFGVWIDSLELKGRCYLGARRGDLAIECYQKIIQLAPEDHLPLYNLALAYIQCDDKKEAMKCLERCLLKEPEFYLATRLIGKIQSQSA